MIREFNGTSQLAMLAAPLPARARVCLALLAADLALHLLRKSPEFDLAQRAVSLASDWQQGKPVDPDALGEALEAEGIGIAFAMIRAHTKSEQERLTWYVLGDALYYAAYHAFRAANRNPWGSISEVDENALDDLGKDLQALEPSSLDFIARAAAYLAQHPESSLTRLKAQIFK
jgi:hypothetical protein